MSKVTVSAICSSGHSHAHLLRQISNQRGSNYCYDELAWADVFWLVPSLIVTMCKCKIQENQPMNGSCGMLPRRRKPTRRLIRSRSKASEPLTPHKYCC